MAGSGQWVVLVVQLGPARQGGAISTPAPYRRHTWMKAQSESEYRGNKLTQLPIAYYIAFGAHGPRAQAPPNEGWKVFGYVCAGIGATFVLFAGIRGFAKGSPSTMNKEYQEATNEYLKVCVTLASFSALQMFWMLVYASRVGGRIVEDEIWEIIGGRS